MTQAGPRGWHAGLVEHRKQRFVADEGPVSYDPTTRSVDAVLSAGSEVARFYGRERLRIDEDSIDLSRVPIPLLDSHNQSSITNAPGRVTSTWFTDQQGEPALAGRLVLNDTPEGRRAEAMIARCEFNSVSIGYIVDTWEIADADGRIIDDVRWDDSDLVYTATRWQLVEASLVSVPADGSASIRTFVRTFAPGGSLNGPGFDVDALVRMQVRTRARMRMRRAGMLVLDEE
jgi:hypothetical protein